MKRPKRKGKPEPIDQLLTSALQRHGIGPQVFAALVVKRTNILLQQVLETHSRNDVFAVSFASNELIIACRHSAAVQEASRLRERMQEDLKREFPSIHLKHIRCQIHRDFSNLSIS